MGPDVSAPVSHGIQSERRADKQRSLSRSQARIIAFIGRRDDFRFLKALKGGNAIKGVGGQVRRQRGIGRKGRAKPEAQWLGLRRN